MSDQILEGLKKLREPFPEHQISKLPKGTKAQNECPANEKVNCKVCGGWHHPRIIHLDYVGHAALTDRLLDVDPMWFWEPLAYKDGLPAFDATGGLWIKLTVCGMTRLGYGHAASTTFKDIGSREKEVIGDALRNAAMRFGAALDLWHKGDLHIEEEEKQGIKTLPNDGAGDSLKQDRKNYITDLASELIDAYKLSDFGAMYNLYHEITDNEEKLFLWSLLDSKVRSKIKSFNKEKEAA